MIKPLQSEFGKNIIEASIVKFIPSLLIKIKNYPTGETTGFFLSIFFCAFNLKVSSGLTNSWEIIKIGYEEIL
jgi:hypothetical protein